MAAVVGAVRRVFEVFRSALLKDAWVRLPGGGGWAWGRLGAVVQGRLRAVGRGWRDAMDGFHCGHLTYKDLVQSETCRT